VESDLKLVNRTSPHPIYNFLEFLKIYLFCAEMLKCYAIDMDILCRYSEEVNKVSDINKGHESGFVVWKEDCSLILQLMRQNDLYLFMFKKCKLIT